MATARVTLYKSITDIVTTASPASLTARSCNMPCHPRVQKGPNRTKRKNVESSKAKRCRHQARVKTNHQSTKHVAGPLRVIKRTHHHHSIQEFQMCLFIDTISASNDPLLHALMTPDMEQVHKFGAAFVCRAQTLKQSSRGA